MSNQFNQSNDDYSVHLKLNTFINAKEAGNELIFVNDYRGVMKRPNAKIVKREDKVFYVTKKEIMKGEEIVVDYGRKYWMRRINLLGPKEKIKVRIAEWTFKWISLWALFFAWLFVYF